jgi:hypothetical protein
MPISELIMGGWMILCGLVCAVYAHKRPNKITGLTPNQYRWLYRVIILCGIAAIILGFWERL